MRGQLAARSRPFKRVAYFLLSRRHGFGDTDANLAPRVIVLVLPSYSLRQLPATRHLRGAVLAAALLTISQTDTVAFDRPHAIRLVVGEKSNQWLDRPGENCFRVVFYLKGATGVAERGLQDKIVAAPKSGEIGHAVGF
jgi:hypothetical protein